MGILDRDVNSRKDKLEVESSDGARKPRARVVHHGNGTSSLYLDLGGDGGHSANSHLDELLKKIEAKREQEESEREEG